jgi:hypothetical protein
MTSNVSSSLCGPIAYSATSAQGAPLDSELFTFDASIPNLTILSYNASKQDESPYLVNITG